MENLSWLTEHADSFLDDDYLLIDCPGQIELYSHIPVMARVAQTLAAAGFSLCAVYLLDATFVTDAAKLIAGNLTALAAMVHLELPHINVRGGGEEWAAQTCLISPLSSSPPHHRCSPSATSSTARPSSATCRRPASLSPRSSPLRRGPALHASTAPSPAS